MTKKIIFFVLLFYFLVLIQNSFLVHLGILRMVPLVLIAVVIISLLEKTESTSDIAAGFIGGLFLDIFSVTGQGIGIFTPWFSLVFPNFFGFYTLLSLILVFLIKIFFKKNVQIPSVKKI